MTEKPENTVEFSLVSFLTLSFSQPQGNCLKLETVINLHHLKRLFVLFLQVKEQIQIRCFNQAHENISTIKINFQFVRDLETETCCIN